MVESKKKEEIRLAIAEHLSHSKKASRSRLLDGVMKTFDISDNSLPTAKYLSLRSLAGIVLDEMEKSGDIAKDSDGEYYLCEEKLVVVEAGKCRQTILALIRQKPLTKTELYKKLEKYFGTEKTVSTEDDNRLKSLAGNQLVKLLQNKTIVFENDTYMIPPKNESVYPTEEIGEEEFDRLFIHRLCEKDGAFFEHFMGHLLEKYYVATGREVVNLCVRGGSDDGGVDVLIDTVDGLGFREVVAVQTKCRKNIKVTETEVRGFYGGMNAQGATRGIFVTTSTFHIAAERFLTSVHDCIGMDGKAVVNMAKRVSYGAKKCGNGYAFDSAAFED